MTKMLRKGKTSPMLNRLLCSPLYFVLIFLYFTIVLHTASGVQHLLFPEDIWLLFTGALEALAIPLLFTLIFPKKKWPLSLLFSILAFYYSILALYHLRSKTLADFGMTFSNVDLLSNANSWGIIKETYRSKDWFNIALFSFLPWLPRLLPAKKQKSSKFPFIPKRFKVVFILLVISTGITPVLFNYNSCNKLTQYFQNGREFFFPHLLPFSPTPLEVTQFKDSLKEKTNFETSLINSQEIKNVFVIFLESFNARYVENKSPEGKEYTPVFNELIKQGVYFDNFYANSMQTAKGHFATLCSRIPHSKYKEMVALKNMKLKCLPEMLEGLGFVPYFIQANEDLGFDNTGDFWKTHGFKEVLAMNDRFISPEEKRQYLWGWGIQDNIMYKKALEYHQQKNNPKTFMTLVTISNHMKFKMIPEHLRLIYPEAGESAAIEKRFANSIRVMDLFIKDFFLKLDELNLRKNSLVILVGDHSFPMGEHGNYFTENTYYNEIHKTPLLILAPGLAPARQKGLASQIDIAPTILSLLNAGNLEHEFMGNSLFNHEENSVSLIQPYDGRYISLIKDNKKFTYHLRTDKKILTDLSIDPNELNNIYKEGDESSYYTYLKKIIMNDQLLEMSNHP